MKMNTGVFMVLFAMAVLIGTGYSTAVNVPLQGAVAGNTTIEDGVYYTINGAMPTPKSTKYTSPIVLNRTLNIKYMIIKNGTVKYGIINHAITGNITNRTYPKLIFNQTPIIELENGTYYRIKNGNITLYNATIALTGNTILKYFKNSTNTTMMGIIKNTPARAIKKTKWMKVKVKRWYRRGGKWRYYWTYRWVKRIYQGLYPV
ncbi:chitobiase/beta-hexosaminidase C-terminal domain-containing protein [Methanothermobacter sp. K4]|uniref:chitobiase/beta-hexosaminidase C-terminal domain-containing protein n=1 Tax=Methanothermobacter sp. K4 TaxID=2913262 RepID=UPI001EDB1CC1|nr:chitobiase/beta-hexosaminidase C-terminal domain-containing protein [Methanothermobacter sp. K4]MCG2828882.1 chitobiase/beta-hexosaminidase C-terminal domain-containing protein [Methanothermobacter sp. K4]